MHIKLPKQIKAQAIENLITEIAGAMEDGGFSEMDACNMQPTSRAARLAAEAAVCVLLAHEIGQEAKTDLDAVLRNHAVG